LTVLPHSVWAKWLSQCRGLSGVCSGPGGGLKTLPQRLCTDKARHVLGWQPVWDFAQSMFRTAEWYSEYARTGDAEGLVNRQLAAFQQAAV
ncbi:MAG: hypothetical protein ACKPJJ_36975, partial [Planctomycetaceae bacterium]